MRRRSRAAAVRPRRLSEFSSRRRWQLGRAPMRRGPALSSCSCNAVSSLRCGIVSRRADSLRPARERGDAEHAVRDRDDNGRRDAVAPVSATFTVRGPPSTHDYFGFRTAVQGREKRSSEADEDQRLLRRNRLPCPALPLDRHRLSKRARRRGQARRGRRLETGFSKFELAARRWLVR